MNLLLLASALALQTHPIAEIDSIVRGGVSRGVYPGAVVVVGTGDTVLMARGIGHFDWRPESRVPHPDSTLYDLASLTKPMATSTLSLISKGCLTRPEVRAPGDRFRPSRDTR